MTPYEAIEKAIENVPVGVGGMEYDMRASMTAAAKCLCWVAIAAALRYIHPGYGGD